MRFTLLARDGRARAGRLETPHGAIATPAFMPVGTLGAVKGIGPWDLESLGAEVMLSNLYHLSLRPGTGRIAELGGIHRFAGWSRPILTDSGGFQVFSLAHLRTVDEAGVRFRSHLDGALVRFTPEGVVAAQAELGVDLAMVLDECPPWPAEREAVAQATERTVRWAAQARECWERSSAGPDSLFAIVQGGVHRELREHCAAALSALDFPGYAIGGVSVGEPLAERRLEVEWSAAALPEERPRYLMGVGTPADILHGVRQGVDLFDCVLPARNGRHGLLFTRSGVVRIKNAVHAGDPRPIDEECACPVCRRLSRAFLHHLFRAGEITAPVLGAMHNLRHYLDFMGEVRKAIYSGRLADLATAVDPLDPKPAGARDVEGVVRPGGDRDTKLGEG
ncbi:MAG: tRNA guanosine(34) transglycosylase Tgt [Holophagales bacterium]|nr:MAG: tRNA guanosine(34) transglycosylase Tgt [Holophagales bacterium]